MKVRLGFMVWLLWCMVAPASLPRLQSPSPRPAAFGCQYPASSIHYPASASSAIHNLPSSISLQWDRNGNLTNDGTRSFSYDPENRLLTNWIVGSWKTEFVYDGLGRRRIVRDYTWQGGQWTKTNETRCLYDGWQTLQERDSGNVPQVAYTRGLDLSGSLAGANGIGGLLARTDANGSLLYHADGAGNITALMDVLQNVPGRYEYGPFGRLVGMWGPMAAVNSMRFSSMPVHRQSGMSLYPIREGYDPTIQRWIQRDPIGEAGGLNLYGFVRNNPLAYVDPYGDDFHVAGASGLLTPGPLGYLSGDTPLENLAASGYNALPEVGNILSNAGQGLMDVLSGLDDGTRELLTRLTGGDPQLGDALNNVLAVAPVGWPEDAAKLGKAAKCIKFPKLGWSNSKPYKDALKKIAQGGRKVDLGFIPTKEQALQLLEGAGGDMKSSELRVQEPHPAPNPHNYPHINYPTPSGGRGTLQIQ